MPASASGPAAPGARVTWLGSVLERAERRPVLFVVALVLLLYVPWLEAAPISGTIEANRLVAAREMLRTGDWVVPRLHGDPYLAKPPFQYWLIGLLSLPFGRVSLVSGRLISALSVVLLCALVTAWGRREGSARIGLQAGVMLALSGVLLEKGVLAELEAVLAVTTACALFFLWRAAVDEPGRAWLVVASGLSLGAAVLTKGPVPLIPFVLGASALAATVRPRKRVLVAAGAALALGVLAAVPWLLLLRSRVGSEAMMEVFGFEVFHRLHAAGATNREPFFYYVPATLAALFPAGLLLPAALCARDPAAAPRRRALVALLLAWSLGTTLVLSLSAGKEVRYLISVLAAWALLMSLGLERGRGVRWLQAYVRFLRKAARIGAWLVPPALVAAGWKAGELPAMTVAALFFAAGVVLAHTGLRAGRAAPLVALALLVAGVKVAWSLGYLEHRVRSKPVMEVGAEIAESVPASVPLHVLGRYEAPIDFAMDRRIVLVEGPVEALEETPGTPLFLLVGPSAELDDAGERWEPVRTWHLREQRYELWRRAPRSP